MDGMQVQKGIQDGQRSSEASNSNTTVPFRESVLEVQ